MWLGFLRLGSRSQNDRVGFPPFEIQKLGVGPETTLGLHRLKCLMKIDEGESGLHQRGSAESSSGYTTGPANPPVEGCRRIHHWREYHAQLVQACTLLQ